MLDTRVSPAQSGPRHSAFAPFHPGHHAPARARRRNPDSAPVPRSPRGRRLTVGPNRLARSEANLIGVALATTALVCALLLLYLLPSAYLWQIGVHQNRLAKQLKALQWQNQVLQKQVADCLYPRLVAEQARKQGMVPGTRLAEYIAPSDSHPPRRAEGAGKGMFGADDARTQGAKSGQANSQRVASRGH